MENKFKDAMKDLTSKALILMALMSAISIWAGYYFGLEGVYLGPWLCSVGFFIITIITYIQIQKL